MDYLKEDNIWKVMEEKDFLCILHDEERIPSKTDKTKFIGNSISNRLPELDIIYVDANKFPKSQLHLAPDGIDFFPVFLWVEDNKIDYAYFSSGIEEIMLWIELVKTGKINKK